jgi:hypothetical protein
MRPILLRRCQMPHPGVAVMAGLFLTALQILPAQSQTATEPLVTRAARDLGVHQCLDAIAKSAEGVIGTQTVTKQDIILNWDRKAPDSAPFFSLTGVLFGKQSSTMSLTAIPEPNGTCDVLVEQVWLAPSPCRKISETNLKKLPASRLIDTIMVHSNPSVPGETFSLVDAGNSCMIVRRQINSSQVPQTEAPQSPQPAPMPSPQSAPVQPSLPAPGALPFQMPQQ